MGYDKEFWDSYAKENESRYNKEFAIFVRDLVASLHCTSVLEIGCGTGIDLRLLPESVKIFGVDLNDLALEMGQKNEKDVIFKKASISNLPFDDSSVDFVFTHQLLNYLDDQTLDKGISEMHRVAKKYIMNCEVFAEGEDTIKGNYRYRDMYKRWLDYKVKIISNVDMHEEIEPDKPRFTLVKKLQS